MKLVRVLTHFLGYRYRKYSGILVPSAPITSRPVYTCIASLIELRVDVVLVWEVDEPGEGRAAPQIRQPSRGFWLLPPLKPVFEVARFESLRGFIHFRLPLR